MQVMMKMISVNGKQPANTGPIHMTTADSIRLWLIGDLFMREMTHRIIRQTVNKNAAAHAICNSLREFGVTHNPDGAKVTFTAVRRAITWQSGY